MKELLMNLLLAVITAAVPVITTYAVGLISKAKDEIGRASCRERVSA